MRRRELGSKAGKGQHDVEKWKKTHRKKERKKKQREVLAHFVTVTSNEPMDHW
jgi:hypothetical protein